MIYKDMLPLVIVVVIFSGLAALVVYWRSHPYQILYHKTGMPHQVGIITAVHYQQKRLTTLVESLNETERLLKAGYHIVIVKNGSSAFMVRCLDGTNEISVHCNGLFSRVRLELIKRFSANFYVVV
jgi:hypothetical protein